MSKNRVGHGDILLDKGEIPASKRRGESYDYGTGKQRSKKEWFIAVSIGTTTLKGKWLLKSKSTVW